MLVDGFNDLHGFRASVPDDGEFDGVMGFAVPVLHVSVKERGAALLTLLSQLEQLRSCVTDSLAHDDAVRRRRGGDL